jgi:thioredoxin-dependent peroxiredoxin
MLKEGDRAPDFAVEDDSGKTVRLKDFHGHPLVVYFYPRADTPGCTIEACAFRDGITDFKKVKAPIVGASPDTVEAQAKFKKKYDLPFPLLADADHKMAEAYGVWKEKNMYGKKSMGIERTTFILDAEGKIQKIFPRVKVEGHADEVLAALKE